MQAVLLYVTLLLIWVVFSGFHTLFFYGCGAVSCLVAVFFATKMGAFSRRGWPAYLNIKLIFYGLWLVKEMFLSSLSVVARVWQVKPDISPTFGKIPTRQTTDVGRAIFANSITLTPGTVCVNVYDDYVDVHALTKEGLKDLQGGKMDGIIRETLD